MKKFSILVAAAFASLAGFTSCEDANECGCSCNVPVIERVEKLEEAGINIAGNVEAGSYVALLGKNLGDVTSIQFGDRTVAIKPAYRTDNSIILQIPSVTKSCIGTLVTTSCPTGYADASLSIVIGTPTVYMMYNEFAADGDKLMLKGSSFVGDQMQVDFWLLDGTIYTAQGADVELVSNDGSQMYVKVPLGAAPSQYLTVRNAAEGKQSTCNIMFRDCRNVLVDFDTKLEMAYAVGAVAKAADGTYSMAALDWASEVPALYSLTGVNNYGVIHDADNWEGILFAPEAGDLEYDEVRTVFGPFKEAIMANPASAADYLVKFEVRVPEANPTNQMVLAFGFCSAANGVPDAVRPYCAGLQMSKVNWDKSSAEEGWKIAGAADFSTYEGKWMTVQIPMSEFMWAFSAGNYLTSAQNFSEGNFSNESDKDFFGDPINKSSYVSKYMGKMQDEDDLYALFGGFGISFNPYDGGSNTSAANKNAHFAIDNIRIVPNDGNGAYYPKLGWGVPKQHYFEAPRKNAYVAN